MKKILSMLSLCLAVVMFLPTAAAAGDMAFSDVKAGDWFYGNVKYVYENGIMNGASATKFDPDGALSRGMCAAIIHRIAGNPEAGTTNKFADVKAGEYYAKAVAWAYGEGIVNGKTATSFDPDGIITRAEFATMLYRYLSAADLVLPVTRDGKPADADRIPTYAADAVTALFRAGVINGRESGAFDPDASVTRAETAAMIERFIKAAETKPADPDPGPDPDPDPDPDPFNPAVPDDNAIGIAFFGNSFVWVPQTPDHFKAIAKDKHEVKVYNRTHSGWSLLNHYNYWRNRSDAAIAYIARKWDIIVLNDGTDSEQLNDHRLNTFNNMIDLLGRDKMYYNLCISSIRKSEDGMEMSEDGLLRLSNKVPSNKQCFIWRDQMKEKLGVSRIMLNCDAFDPAIRFKPTDFWYVDNGHPNKLYGYCNALALYCTIFDEPCAEQNNGILKDADIPGKTPGEKEAFMKMIKNYVQEQLDFQKAD